MDWRGAPKGEYVPQKVGLQSKQKNFPPTTFHRHWIFLFIRTVTNNILSVSSNFYRQLCLFAFLKILNKTRSDLNLTNPLKKFAPFFTELEKIRKFWFSLTLWPAFPKNHWKDTHLAFLCLILNLHLECSRLHIGILSHRFLV